MAQVIKIKRSTSTAAPSTLENGELAYSSNSDKLFIGRPGGTTGDIDAIGGKFFTDLLDHTPGTVTASSALIVDASSKLDVLNVDNITLNGNSITSTNLNGDIEVTPNGTGDLILDGQNWPQADGSTGQFLKTDGSGQLAWATVVSDFTISDGSTTDTFTTGDTLTFTGGTNITTTVSNDQVTITGLSDSEIRGLVSASGDLSYNSATGVFSVTTYKSADFDTDLASKTTDDVSEGVTNLYWTTARGEAMFDSKLAAADTGDLTEGTNLYWTTARGEAMFDSKLAAADTDDLSEGSTNLYYTDTRARASISVTDAGGDGSLAYNSSTGVITYTGPSAAEVQAHITAGTGVSIASGVVSIGQAVETTSNVNFATLETTGNVIVGGDLTVNGTVTSVNSTTVELGDNILLLNSGETGSPTANAGLEVERGTVANVVFRWNETTDKWEVTQDGTNFYVLIDSNNFETEITQLDGGTF